MRTKKTTKKLSRSRLRYSAVQDTLILSLCSNISTISNIIRRSPMLSLYYGQTCLNMRTRKESSIISAHAHYHHTSWRSPTGLREDWTWSLWGLLCFLIEWKVILTLMRWNVEQVDGFSVSIWMWIVQRTCIAARRTNCRIANAQREAQRCWLNTFFASSVFQLPLVAPPLDRKP